MNIVALLSRCQYERFLSLPWTGKFSPICKDDGSYVNRQCHGEYCWCVDEFGNELHRTRTTEKIDCASPQYQGILVVPGVFLFSTLYSFVFSSSKNNFIIMITIFFIINIIIIIVLIFSLFVDLLSFFVHSFHCISVCLSGCNIFQLQFIILSHFLLIIIFFFLLLSFFFFFIRFFSISAAISTFCLLFFPSLLLILSHYYHLPIL